MLSIGHFEQFNQRLVELLPKELSSNYFHALILDSKNVARIARKMRRLPGVETVVLTSKEQLATQVKERMKSLSLDISTDLMTASFQGLQVIFEPGVKVRSMELIRNYLSRLVGKESVTIGDTHLEGEKDVEVGLLLSKVKRWSGYLIITLLAILWATSLHFLAQQVWQKAYLLEQFQRRSSIALKIILLHGSATLVVTTTLILLIGVPATINLLVLLAVAVAGVLLQLRRVEWNPAG